MNTLFHIKKSLTTILTLVMLLSIVGPAKAHENKVEMPIASLFFVRMTGAGSPTCSPTTRLSMLMKS